MTWLTVLRLVLSIAARLTEIVRDEKLMAAGEARAALGAIQMQQKRVGKAIEARRQVRAVVKSKPEIIREEDENMRQD